MQALDFPYSDQFLGVFHQFLAGDFKTVSRLTTATFAAFAFALECSVWFAVQSIYAHVGLDRL